MRILIISKEVWRNDQNGGNTLTWMFSRFPKDTEFANIFCSEGVPDNNICNRYFKLTSKMVGKSFLNRNSEGAGLEFCKDAISYNNENDSYDVSNTGKKSRLSCITNSEWLRDIVWKLGKYKSQKLKDFINDFNPDIIYAPGYGVNYMNFLIQWITSFTACPVVSLISDDYYSFHQQRINPLFWIRLLFLRRNVRKTVKLYKLVYTMTDDQKKQLDKDFGISSKIMRKGADFSGVTIKNIKEDEVIRIVHVGNLYHNRWKTLDKLLDSINYVNQDKKKYALEIVTSYHVDDKIINRLKRKGAILHFNISEQALRDLYGKCDIAVHVEGFDLLNRIKMRMSFSTKIIEYLASGCAIMLICDKRQGTYRYLDSCGVAYTVENPDMIIDTLNDIYRNKEKLIDMKHKAYDFGKRNHSIAMVSQMIYADFQNLIKNRNRIY